MQQQRRRPARLRRFRSCSQNGAPRAEIDAFKLWLAFIDHGDTKTDNHKFACLEVERNADGTRSCEPGEAVFYVGDMGSTFGYSSSSEKKATLDAWRKKESDQGEWRTLYHDREECRRHQHQRRRPQAAGRSNFSDCSTPRNKTERSRRVFAASRNAERDQPAAEWAAEFERKARMIIDARCSN